MQSTDKDLNTTQIDYEHRRRIQRRRRARKIKRRRQILSLSILTIIILTLVIKLISCSNKQVIKGYSPALMWYYTNAITEERTQKLFYSSEEISNQVLEPITKIKDEYLVEGSNHIKKVDKYAYDAGEICNYIEKDSNDLNKKIVFLTFDDGPNLQITPQILETLKKENARATFFLVGKSITEKHAPVMREIITNGNSIATHSFTHNYSLLYPGRTVNPDRVITEVQMTNEALRKFFGDNFYSSVFRYPGGEMSWNNTKAANDLLAKNNINWIDWNTLTGDAQPKSDRPTTTAGQVEYVRKSLQENKSTNIAVVLSHDAINKQLTADSLSSVIKYFRDNGYEFGILK
ncbi:peptidoglycan/xylan/chitin deacetylase (PgdA/CDA1 family) [Peptoniphilus olsenii]|uniref:Peptidoglycan/xylan/chitin deacetylase (PgdA/CDA1 family) n=1 Tax=Peptoniphilus olsenii TaxID=411570 RepID=A0ABV2JA48_9FIRM